MLPDQEGEMNAQWPAGGDSSDWKKTSDCIEALKKNDPKVLLIYDLSKCFPNEFMVSIPSFTSYLIMQDVHFVIYDPMRNKTHDNAGYAARSTHHVLGRANTCL